jgi:predicted AAA+ superfamily ATPase
MKRNAIIHLENWKNRPNRMPLLVRGARQVGKTWLIREFAKQNFKSWVELNLEAQPELHSIFDQFFGKPKEFISALSLFTSQTIVPGETLLFIDEAQECRNALVSLRYFKELMPELHVIAAGSLIEFALRDLSFPVGRIESMHLFPLSFAEFLTAKNGEEWVKSLSGLKLNEPLSEALHEKLLDEVSHYFLIGGMPAVVNTWVSTRDWNVVQEAQKILVSTYRSDFHKYASHATVEHIKKVFDSVPRLLGQKFKYSNVDRETKSREISKASYLLEEAGIIYRVCHSSGNGVPLSSESNSTKFKMFFLDIGLCNRILGLSLSQLFIERKTLFANRGQLAEQFVAQELISLTPRNDEPRLFYWQRESKSSLAEVDFLFELEDQVIPIEVKAAVGGKTKSLKLFIEEKHSSSAAKISSAQWRQTRLDTAVVQSLSFYAIPRILMGRQF